MQAESAVEPDRRTVLASLEGIIASSAGLTNDACILVTHGLPGWAEIAFVTELYWNRRRKKFRVRLHGKRVGGLDITASPGERGILPEHWVLYSGSTHRRPVRS